MSEIQNSIHNNTYLVSPIRLETWVQKLNASVNSILCKNKQINQTNEQRVDQRVHLTLKAHKLAEILKWLLFYWVLTKQTGKYFGTHRKEEEINLR